MEKQQNSAVLSSYLKWHAGAVIALIAVTFLLYASTLYHGFIFSWDDYDYIVNNPAVHGFSLAHIKTVFSNFYVGNYAPLHLISYMLDYQFWGLNPAGYHLGNILLHALNGILIYRLFLKLELPIVPALLGAALFVLHPVQVESVAWVAERKNVLSALFFLLALLSYIDYKQAAACRMRNYILSLTFLACALLSKSAAVIFPVVIIFYDYCYCSASRRLKLLDKLPFILLTLAACILTIKSQDTNAGGGMRGYPGGTPLTALWTMTPVFLSYLKDLVYPLELSPYYMVPIRKTIDGDVVISAAILLCLAGVGFMSVKRWPKLLFFFSVYVLSLLPVLQIVPILTLKNDRYLYYPMIGAAGAVAMFISVLMLKTGRLRIATVAVAIIVCTALGGIAYYQSQIWKNSITLWNFALRQNPENMLAWLMLAKGHTNLGNSREAISAITTYNNFKSKYGPLRGWDGPGS
jgi:hypothetical protein